MLSSNVPVRKAKVSLSDYPFRRDIEVRLLMSQLSVQEVDVLREIIHHSLKISIEQFAEEVEIEEEILLPILDKLSITKLFKRQNKHLIVDKEMRKYFEVKIEKFDDNFQPDLDFLQSILNKVPIHVLPLWYAIPRSSDNIFESMIEKHFLTPKVYRQYLSELHFDIPVLKAIIQEAFRPPHFKVPTSELMAKFHLTHECLEEYLLLLEYHLTCCLSYQKVDNRWQEVVTPFAEWREYLQFEFETKALPIQGTIAKDQEIEFQFIKDLTAFLQACQSKKASSKDVKNACLSKALQLEFIKQSASGQITLTEKGKTWMSKPLFEQVNYLANDPLNTLTNIEDFSSLWNIRNIHLVEKSLRRLLPREWIELQDFLQGFIAPIADKEPVTLKNKGKKWKYAIPTYTNQEKEFIQAIIMERLAELGVVETGSYEGKACFCVTPFGHHFIQ